MTDIAAAMLAVSLMTGLPVPPPPIVVETREEMPCAGEAKRPVGLYCMGHVWLRDDATQAVAVHEMVHHYQHHYHAEMLELHAYELERKWSRQ